MDGDGHVARITGTVDGVATGSGRWVRVSREATLGLLRSPLGRLLGGSLTAIAYRGRSSDRRLVTPVEYVRDGDGVIIPVADPDRKQWWRNVRAAPDVTLLLDGHERTGRATILSAPGSGEVLAAYVAALPCAARAAASSALAVVVDLADARP